MRLILLTVAWMGGIILGHVLWVQGVVGCGTPWWLTALPAGLALVACVFWRARPRAAAGAASALMLFLGAWRYGMQPLANCAGSDALAHYNADGKGQATWVTVEGVVSAYPDERDTQTYYRLEAETLRLDGQARSVHGAVLVQAPTTPAWRYGDRLRVAGLLETPTAFADFDYRAYLARQGIYSILRRAQPTLVAYGRGNPVLAALYDLRNAGRSVLERSLPEPAAGLAKGMMLGIESGIAPELNRVFKDVGVAHIIVISGSNIALLAGIALTWLGHGLGRRRAAPWAIGLILLYVVLVGAGAASLRAGIMVALALGAIIFGRQNTPLVLLAASGLVMTALDPRVLWDIGFQFSVLATLGLLLFMPRLQVRLDAWLDTRLPAGPARDTGHFVGDAVVITTSAQLLVLPLMIYYFGRASLVSLVANVLILPAQPPLLATGLVTLAGGLVWPLLGRVLAVAPWLFLTYTSEVSRLLAGLPLAAVDTGSWGRSLAILYYVALGAVFCWRWLGRHGFLSRLAPVRARLRSRRLAAVWGLAGLLMVAVAILAGRPDGRLHLYYLPHIGGDATLVVSPGGHRIVVWDGLGDRGAVRTALRGQDPDTWLAPTPALHGLAVMGLDPLILAPGQRLRLDAGVTLSRLAAGDQWVFLLQYRDFRAVLPANLSQENQVALAASDAGRGLSVVKSPDPGTGAWPSPELLRSAASRLILWPQDSTYPPGVADLLTRLGARRVAADAMLEVMTDGQKLWLRSWSGQARR